MTRWPRTPFIQSAPLGHLNAAVLICPVIEFANGTATHDELNQSIFGPNSPVLT